MARNNQHTNYNFMEHMRHIINEIEKLKPEAEACNESCPAFGCPEKLCSEKFINNVGYNSTSSPHLQNKSSTIGSRNLTCELNSPKIFSPPSLTFSPPYKEKNSSCIISVCQVPSTKSRIPPRHSGLISYLESSPSQICYPQIQGSINTNAQIRQQQQNLQLPRSNCIPEQSLQRHQILSSQFHHQQPCPQSSSYIVSIPFQ